MSDTTAKNVDTIVTMAKDENLSTLVAEFKSKAYPVLLDKLNRAAEEWIKTLSLGQSIVRLERFLTAWKIDYKKDQNHKTK